MSRLPRLPEGVISSINSYNRTTYQDNRVSTHFNYTDDDDERVGLFNCQIRITWNTNIGAYWRHNAAVISFETYERDDDEILKFEINKKLKELPDYQTIFGELEEEVGDGGYGLHGISAQQDENRIQLHLQFYYEKEENEEEEDEFINIDFNGDRGTRIREAAKFLTAHTLVETMNLLIPAPDTPLQDYLTIEEDEGNRFLINQKGEEHLEDGYNEITDRYIDRRNDYKLLQNDQRIHSFDFWSDHIDTTPREPMRLHSATTTTSFTLVNNKQLPLSSGKGGATMNQLKF